MVQLWVVVHVILRFAWWRTTGPTSATSTGTSTSTATSRAAATATATATERDTAHANGQGQGGGQTAPSRRNSVGRPGRHARNLKIRRRPERTTCVGTFYARRAPGPGACAYSVDGGRLIPDEVVQEPEVEVHDEVLLVLWQALDVAPLGDDVAQLRELARY